MKLRDQGDDAAIELLVPEAKAIERAIDLLRRIAKWPTPEQETAAVGKEALETILAACAPAKWNKAE